MGRITTEMQTLKYRMRAWLNRLHRSAAFSQQRREQTDAAVKPGLSGLPASPAQGHRGDFIPAQRGVRTHFIFFILYFSFFISPPGVSPSSAQETADKPAAPAAAEVQDSARVLLDQAERLYRKMTTPAEQLHFGYDIFDMGPGTFEPPTLGAVDPGYPVGPRDEILISVWGQVELNFQLTVDRDGSISIPKVGRLQVSGVALGDLQGKIIRFLSRAYSGVREDQTRATAFVDVSLGKLRDIKVFVVGEVRRPGAYTLSATSTILNALYHAGGPTPKGSLREIRLTRHDRTAGTLDLYRFILEGDKGEDVRLQNGDVILAPPVGKEVRLTGRVHRPAIYELRADEGLRRLIEIAGGLAADAYTGRMQIERIVGNEGREVIDVDFGRVRGVPDTDVSLRDGDAVTVFEVPKRLEDVVYIEGYVRRPGRYEIRPEMRVSDLIREADGVWPEAFPGRADIVRTNPDLTRDLVRFHLGRALTEAPQADPLLKPLDEVKIYSIHTFGWKEFVTIQGEVKKPGQYELLDGMTLKDLIAQAGGLTEAAYDASAEVSRIADGSTTSVQVLQAEIDSDYGVDRDPSGFVLRNRDMVFVRQNPDYRPQRNVTLEGEVAFPGVYTLRDDRERLSSLIARAGGLRETAFADGAKFYRGPRDSTGLIQVDLAGALKRPGGDVDPVLADGDAIEVPKDPGVVWVAGAVFYPKAVRFEAGKNARHYIRQAGGMTRQADKGRIYVIMANGAVKKKGFWGWPGVISGSRIVVPEKPVRK